ncbi:unnamed protein product, partial [Prunus brigantina]
HGHHPQAPTPKPIQQPPSTQTHPIKYCRAKVAAAKKCPRSFENGGSHGKPNLTSQPSACSSLIHTQNPRFNARSSVGLHIYFSIRRTLL